MPIVAGVALLIWVRWRLSGLPWVDFVLLRGARVYVHLWHRWSCNHPANLPACGPVLIIANHTCSADPNFLLAGCERPISFLVAAEHFNVHPVARAILDHFHCVPVDRNGRDFSALRQALRRLEEGRAVCLFPEGNLSGVSAGRTLPPKHGVGYLALYTHAPVYLAHITGGPQTERLLDSWVRPSRRAVRVHFSGPVDLFAYYGRPINRRLIVEVTEALMARIKGLR
jgi:1-acyl-sn-glycerol-3-phosphate acyltransferase